ncbi:STAS/SEC14 domain-containing protein [Sulfurimonas sp.]
MSVVKHGMSVNISRRADDFFFMQIKINDTITHNDYEMMTQVLNDAIDGVHNPEVRVLMDATEFKGWELRATWDDFVFGIEFRAVFTKMAFIGTKTWEMHGINVGNWFMSDEVKFFRSKDEAYIWINQIKELPTNPLEKDLYSRKDDIRDKFESFFMSNLRVTDHDASEILVSILENKLKEIKADIKVGKYKDYYL